jgi:hypothetical protein
MAKKKAKKSTKKAKPKKAAKKAKPKKAAKKAKPKKAAKKAKPKKAAKKAKPKKAAKKAKPKKAAKKAKPKKAAKKAKPKKAQPKKAARKPVKARNVGALQQMMEQGFQLVRKNENSLARRIEEVSQAGERILDQVETLQGDTGSVETAPIAARLKKVDGAILTLQGDLRELSKESDLCNAGPLVEKLPAMEASVRALSGAVESMKGMFRDFQAKINEVTAKFNMHSHFLKAKNWNQDLFFHADPASAEDRDRALPETPRGLGIKPTRLGQAPEGHVVNLRLTPPRHWDDPVIWFDNIGLIEEEEEKGAN